MHAYLHEHMYKNWNVFVFNILIRGQMSALSYLFKRFTVPKRFIGNSFYDKVVKQYYTDTLK